MKHTIICGHVLDVLKKLPDESVDTVITSPPYWGGLRDYGEETCTIWDGDPTCKHEWVECSQKFSKPHHGVSSNTLKIASVTKDAENKSFSSGEFCRRCGAWRGQLGHEPFLNLYIEHLLEIMQEVRRVLKKTGVVFWNQGDTYASGGKSRMGGLGKSSYEYRKHAGRCRTNEIPSKSLCLQNERFVIRCVDELGFRLRDRIVWCLAEDTMMFIERNGKFLYLPLKDVSVGDNVFTVDKQCKIRKIKIKKKLEIGEKQVIKITTKSGRKVVCTEEHRFPVKCSYYYGRYLNLNKCNWKQAGELSDRDHLWVNYDLSEILIDGTDEDYKRGWIIGFFLAEGSFLKRIKKYDIVDRYTRGRKLKEPVVVYDGVKFSCGETDLDKGFVDNLREFCIKIRHHEYNGKAIYIESWDKTLLNLISQYVEGSTCYDKKLNQLVWNESRRFIQGIIDGFLDGDGFYDKQNDRWRVGITSRNKELVDQLMLACRLVGYEFRNEGIQKTNYPGKYMLRFVIRKRVRRKRYHSLYLDQIDKIERVGKKKVYDTEIDFLYHGKNTDKPTISKKKVRYNHLYFLGNGIWTHNSKKVWISKTNTTIGSAMPTSANDRCAFTYEPVYVLVKSLRYYWDQDAIRTPLKATTKERVKHAFNPTKGDIQGAVKHTGAQHFAERVNQGELTGANRPNVWFINLEPSSLPHYAAFPTALVSSCLLAGCPRYICKKCGRPRRRITDKNYLPTRLGLNTGKGKSGTDSDPNKSLHQRDISRYRMQIQYKTLGWTDCGCNAGYDSGVVMDIFAGTGTVGVVAEQVGFNSIQIDLNKEYCEIAYQRLKPLVAQTKLGREPSVIERIGF